jgi:hypothetical protein
MSVAPSDDDDDDDDDDDNEQASSTRVRGIERGYGRVSVS